MQEVMMVERPSKWTKSAWLVDVPITRTDDNAKRVVQILNTALANLGADISGLNVTEEGVVSLTAEWTAIKSEATLERGIHGDPANCRGCQ